MAQTGSRIAPETQQVLAYIAGQGDEGATMAEMKAALHVEHAEAAAHLGTLLVRGKIVGAGTMRNGTNVYRVVHG